MTKQAQLMRDLQHAGVVAPRVDASMAAAKPSGPEPLAESPAAAPSATPKGRAASAPRVRHSADARRLSPMDISFGFPFSFSP